jgi:CheY-like chemotaxis protein
VTRPSSPILLVDEGDATAALVTHLARAGYSTLTAPTGEEALELAHERVPALVLLEICLPGICGYEVRRQLKATFGDAYRRELVPALG